MKRGSFLPPGGRCQLGDRSGGKPTGRRAFSRPLVGAGRGGGAAWRANLNRRILSARPQSDQPHVNCLEDAAEVVKDVVIRDAQNVIALRRERG